MPDRHPPVVPGEVVVRVETQWEPAPGVRIDGQTHSTNRPPTPQLSATLNAFLETTGMLSAECLSQPPDNATLREPGNAAPGAVSLFVLRFSGGTPVEELVQRVKAIPGVLAAEPNYMGSLAYAPTDPLYGETADHLARIGMERAWDVQPGAPSSLLVAVLDSGVDPYHEDLAPVLSPDSYNFVEGNNSLFDDLGHGTRVAGILAAAGNNTKGIAGVAFGSTVLSCDVVDGQGLLTSAHVIAALNYAVFKGAKVINMSFQFYAKSQLLEEACNAAAQHAVLVASAGNQNQGDRPVYPASYDSVIGVGATELTTNQRAAFSNYNGTQTGLVDLVAPGVNIFTTIPGSAYDGLYTSGTSFAAPMVSGVAALLQAMYPTQSPRGIVKHLEETATPVGLWAGYGVVSGVGALQVAMTPRLAVVSVSIDDSSAYSGANNGDGRWQKGETVALLVALRNDGKDITNAAGVLSTTDAFVTVGDASGAWGVIQSGQTVGNADPFNNVVLSGLSDAHPVPFTLQASADGGSYLQTLTFTMSAEALYMPPTFIATDTTWTADKTYLIANQTIVVSGATLTIEPGTVVQFEPGLDNKLEVRGGIHAVGTPTRAIIFRSGRSDAGVATNVSFDGHEKRVESVALSPDGTKLLTGSRDQTARLWDTSTGLLLHAFPTGGEVFSVAFSPDGTQALVGSGVPANSVSLWGISTGSLIKNFEPTYTWGEVLAVAFSPDGTQLLTASTIDNSAKLWHAASGTIVRTFSGHTAYVESVAFSPDGSKVVTGSMDHTARIWQVSSGTAIHTLSGHGADVHSVRFSPDGTMVLTGSSDGTAKLWNTTTGSLVRTLDPGGGSVAFSPDGTEVVSTCGDNTLSLWDSAGGSMLGRFHGREAEITSVAFASDGSKVFAGSADGSVDVVDTSDFWAANGGLWIRNTATTAQFAHCEFHFGPVLDESAHGSYQDCLFDRTGGSASLMASNLVQPVVRCTVSDNPEGDGIRADNADVQDSTAVGNSGTGIIGSVLTGCVALANVAGMEGQSATGCIVRDNTGVGLHVSTNAFDCVAFGHGSAGIIAGATAIACTAEQNAIGIQAAELDFCLARDNAGIGLQGTSADSRAESNGGTGIAGNSVLRCVVVGNGAGLITGSAEATTVAANQGTGITGGTILSCAIHNNRGGGLSVPASVANSWIVGNQGVGIVGRGAPYTAISNSTIRDNAGSGVKRSGSMHGCNLRANGGPTGYDYEETRLSTELLQVDLTGNYWGPVTTPLMNLHPWGTYYNIPRIRDLVDNTSLCEAKYAGHLASAVAAGPDSTAPAFLLDVTPNLANAVNVGLATFTLVFSEPMDTNVQPAVTFGLLAPYTDRIVSSIGWQNSTTWQGVYAMGIQTGDGVNTLRVSQARAADGFVIPDDSYHQFEIETWTGTSASVSKGVASPLSPSTMSLAWDSSLDSKIAGYLVVRSLSASGPYLRVDSVDKMVHEYTDTGLSGGTRYFYQVLEYDGNSNSRELTAPFSGQTFDAPTSTPTPSFTPTSTFSPTSTRTPSYTATPTATPTPTWTRMWTPTFTRTFSPTETATPTRTATATETPTMTLTATPSWTATRTPSHTATPTPTLTPTRTDTATDTATPTPTATATITWTSTPTLTTTFTPTATPTQPWPLRLDLDHDGTVGTEDLLILMEFCARQDSKGDVNNDGSVDRLDVLLFALYWRYPAKTK